MVGNVHVHDLRVVHCRDLLWNDAGPSYGRDGGKDFDSLSDALVDAAIIRHLRK